MENTSDSQGHVKKKVIVRHKKSTHTYINEGLDLAEKNNNQADPAFENLQNGSNVPTKPIYVNVPINDANDPDVYEDVSTKNDKKSDVYEDVSTKNDKNPDVHEHVSTKKDKKPDEYEDISLNSFNYACHGWVQWISHFLTVNWHGRVKICTIIVITVIMTTTFVSILFVTTFRKGLKISFIFMY